MVVRALIAEDEPLARRTLREFAGELDWLQVVGEAADGAEAVRMIDALRPDLVFMDVQMPELSGLEVLRRIQHDPEVVFTTAHDEYAIAAFELEALDYLRKPFGRERFRASAERVRRRLEPGAAPSSSSAPAAAERARAALDARGPMDRIFVRDRGRIVPLRVESIARLEAADDYVTVHADGRAYLVNLSLSEFESRLDPARFRRVHRSHVVNLDHVASLRPYDDARRLVITLADGAEVVASRAGSLELRTLIA
ncbi:MAG TPA: LytTR family DNA-binding domain-containing protein [Longimicrobium sp.]|jgi:two-component system LytT family response regulator|uniref:LytR/AlgR family response regulator transcription factor n=1 Tax=Longimicrobium sp. TaxID=2029185 RepID=UPI002ED816E8